MLLNTTRPKGIKNRILSDYGHLSNEDCGYALVECINEDTKEIVLAHLSEEANTRELAYNTVTDILEKRELIIRILKLQQPGNLRFMRVDLNRFTFLFLDFLL